MSFLMDAGDVALLDTLAGECRISRARMARWCVLQMLRKNEAVTDEP